MTYLKLLDSTLSWKKKGKKEKKKETKKNKKDKSIYICIFI